MRIEHNRDSSTTYFFSSSGQQIRKQLEAQLASARPITVQQAHVPAAEVGPAVTSFNAHLRNSDWANCAPHAAGELGTQPGQQRAAQPASNIAERELQHSKDDRASGSGRKSHHRNSAQPALGPQAGLSQSDAHVRANLERTWTEQSELEAAELQAPFR